MLRRELRPPTTLDRIRSVWFRWSGEVVRRGYAAVRSVGAIGPDSPAGRRFGAFGPGSIVCFPMGAITNEHAICIGRSTMVAGHVSLSAGWGPGQPGLHRTLVIGDRCLIGRFSSIVAHRSIEIGDDVWTGPNVYITDMNHGYEDLDLPISEQYQAELPVRIGNGSWLGTNVVVLPGVRIGEHVVVGAGSVVTGDLPDRSVAVGVPAKVVRRHDGTAWAAVRAQGWVPTDDERVGEPA